MLSAVQNLKSVPQTIVTLSPLEKRKLKEVGNETKQQSQNDEAKPNNESVQQPSAAFPDRPRLDRIPENASPKNRFSRQPSATFPDRPRMDRIPKDASPKSRFNRTPNSPSNGRGKGGKGRKGGNRRDSRDKRDQGERDQQTVLATTPGFGETEGASLNQQNRFRDLQGIRGAGVPGVDRSRKNDMNGVPHRLVPEWRRIQLAHSSGQCIGVVLKDTRRAQSTLGRHMSTEHRGLIKYIVQETSLQPDSPVNFLDTISEIIVDALLTMAKTSASDVKVREPNPLLPIAEDNHVVPFLPHLIGQYNWPVHNMVAQIYVTTDFDPDEHIAIYQKWIIGHEWYTAYGIPFTQKYFPSINSEGIEPYTITVQGAEGVLRTLEANASGIIVSSRGDHLEGIYDDKIEQQHQATLSYITEANAQAIARTTAQELRQ
jgi:hypothetical protein